MKIILTIYAFIAIAIPLHASEFPLEPWVFPRASVKEKGSPFSKSEYPDGRVEELRTDFAQFATDASFREVLAFYLKKSRITPPNESIVGREFPGTDRFLPAHWVARGEFGEGSVATVLHYIREDCATAAFSIVNPTELESLTIMVSRGKDEKQTVIQIIRNPVAPEVAVKAEQKK